MKVPYDEDLATHVSPESCGGVGNETAEALTGENAGGLLSSEITTARVPTLSLGGEGNIRHSVKRELRRNPAESENLACVEASWAEIERSKKLLSFKAGIGESRAKRESLKRGRYKMGIMFSVRQLSRCGSILCAIAKGINQLKIISSYKFNFMHSVNSFYVKTFFLTIFNGVY